MKNVTNDFKNQIKKLGKEINVEISYDDGYESVTLTNSDINRADLSYDGALLKSVMKKLELDSNVDIPIDTLINFQFGVKVGNDYEYIDYGTFKVISSEKQEDTNSYKLTCYDKIIEFMKGYTSSSLVFPMTLSSFLNAICTELNLELESTSFANSSQTLNYNPFLDANGNDLGYTYRDILDDIAEATGGIICINNNDKIEVRYINNVVLPNEYSQLDYIVSTGTQYFDLGVTGNQDTKFEMCIVPSGDMGSNRHPFGDLTNTSKAITFNLNNNAGATSRFGNQVIKQSCNMQSNKLYIISASKDGYIIKQGDTARTYWSPTYNTFTTADTLRVLSIKSSSGISSSGFRGKFYWCKVYDNNRLKFNLIPCIRKSDDEIGLYDLVNKVFYEKLGTGNLTSGNVVDNSGLINERSLKDINVKFGETYGLINSVVLSRAGESDNVYLRDETSVTNNGLCEIKIVDNQIMNDNNRSDYLPELLNAVNGLAYSINDFKSTGICYLELGDKYNVEIGENSYSCIMFNDEILIENGLEENIYTKIPEQSETDYAKADKTDRKINQAYSIVDKQGLTITNLVSQTTQSQQLNDERILELQQRTNTVEQTINSQQATIEVMQQDIIDGQETLRNSLVTIDINGINVSTNTSAIQTLMTNEKFVIKSGNQILAFFGYDVDTNSTKAEMDNLTVTNYFIAGNHRVEKITISGEDRTGWFYIG